MADMTQTASAPQSAWTTRFSTLVETFRAHRARRRVFNETLRELSALSNRDLSDLGLSRSEIRRVAWQAAQDA